MIALVETVKRFLGRFKQQDFEFVIDNWSVFRAQNIDIPAVGRAKAKFIRELIERIKVIFVVIVVYGTCAYAVYLQLNWIDESFYELAQFYSVSLKCSNRQTLRQTDGWTDGRHTDGSQHS